MGSLVGASEEIRRNAGTDSSLNDYTVSVRSSFHGRLSDTTDIRQII